MVQFLSHVYLVIWARKVCSNLHMPYSEINIVSESLFTESSLISNRNISNYSRPTLEQETGSVKTISTIYVKTFNASENCYWEQNRRWDCSTKLIFINDLWKRKSEILLFNKFTIHFLFLFSFLFYFIRKSI